MNADEAGQRAIVVPRSVATSGYPRSGCCFSSTSRSLAALGMTTKFRPRRVCAVSGLVRVQQLMLVSKTELSPPDPEIPRRSQIWVHPAIPGQSAVMDRAAAAETTDKTLKPLPDSMRRLDPLPAIPQLLNYLNVTRLPLGLVLFFGPQPKAKRVIRDSTREFPVRSR